MNSQGDGAGTGARAGQPQRAGRSTWREDGGKKPCGLTGGRSPSPPGAGQKGTTPTRNRTNAERRQE